MEGLSSPVPRDEAELRPASAFRGWLVVSVGVPIDERARQVTLALPESAWAPAIRQDDEAREGAWLAGPGTLDLAGLPAGARAICRRERPHPRAQLSFTDAGGHRFQVLL
ncbi:MAG: hypothetical protein K2Q09_09960, partial [Phycisphaerales bacterium]|nr:hypothetical protein [Phycisphaerales bacterium]